MLTPLVPQLNVPQCDIPRSVDPEGHKVVPNISTILPIAVGNGSGGLGERLRKGQSFCDPIDSAGEGQPYDRSRVRHMPYSMWRERLLMWSRWESERCVGQNGAIPRLGFRSMCMQDSPIGVRDSKWVWRKQDAFC